jgi:hypothetical protein
MRAAGRPLATYLSRRAGDRTASSRTRRGSSTARAQGGGCLQVALRDRARLGQLIPLDPARRLVIVTSSAWPVASGAEMSVRRARLIEDISRAVDAQVGAR